MAKIVAQSDNIADAFYRLASESPDMLVYSQAIADPTTPDAVRSKRSATYREVRGRVNKISRYLQSIGVIPGSRVAILSGTRPEWMEADIAILAVGAVSVSIYQSLPEDDIAYILYDSGSEVVIAENKEQVDKLLKVCSTTSNIPGHEDRKECQVEIALKKIISIEDVDKHDDVTLLSDLLAEDDADAPESLDSVSRGDLAALVYTSGTTGPPKGVMQTHGNHLANVRQAFDSGLIDDGTSLSLFLPLAHSFAKLVGYLGFLTPAQLRFPAILDPKCSKLNPSSISKDIAEADANVVPVVPRLLEKMRDGVQAAQSQSGLKGKLVTLTLWSAGENFKAMKAGNSAPILAKIGFALTGSLRAKIQRMLFGNDLSYCLSGGAKLSLDVAEFFVALGIPIREGYGLTETAVATNVARKETPLGSVGPVLAPDIELKLLEDDEICFRGPNVALGYYNRKTATDKSWDEEGWFHTGDLGSLDEDQNLRIVGRKKEIIVTSGGKNIAPNDIEALIKNSPLVSQVVVIGDGRKYCAALITLSDVGVEAFAKKERIANTEALHSNELVYNKIWAHVQSVNKTLASFETIKKIHILAEDFTVENGLLTPTFKVKRSLVEKTFADEINALY
jgi:long-chain acyl-CoA synthetase